MAKKLFIFIFTISISLLLFYSCEQSTSPTVGESVILGTVRDLLTNQPLQGVYVRTVPASDVDTTDALGQYKLTGLAQGSYLIIFSKPNYKTDTVARTVSGKDTLTVNVNMTFGDVMAFYGLVVNESFTGSSFSGVDLYEGKVVTENNPIRDIQFKDSNGTRHNFYFRSGHLSLNNLLPAGYETEFSQLLGMYTKAQFDTLSKRWDVVGREINPDWDFGYHYTNYFNVFSSNSPGPVYSFYLKGRYPSQNGGRRVYGLLLIRELIYDSANDIYKVTIDVKINKDSKNYFIP
ncbi:MAG: carboxypeptidase-like regulatory domain-containing protein [Ignavibacteria bacterium]|nr:carboxypeptidase-like regulatory domain-containing protein [Ignavibacteria bacterium]